MKSKILLFYVCVTFCDQIWANGDSSRSNYSLNGFDFQQYLESLLMERFDDFNLTNDCMLIWTSLRNSLVKFKSSRLSWPKKS